MAIRVLTADNVRRALPMRAAIRAMKAAFQQFSDGEATVPLRSRIEVEDANGIALFMPAHVKGGSEVSAGTLAVKAVSVFGDNPRRNLPVIHAIVLVLNASTGQPLALMEGGTLTAVRTGAGSGAATDLLASAEARTVAIFGSGVQARTQLEAVCTIRTIERVWVFSPTPTSTHKFASEMSGKGPIPSEVLVAKSPQEAVAEADIICTATTSSRPVFDSKHLQPGAHINGVGSYTPAMQEVDVETVRRSLIIVDSRESAMAEAGDLIIPMQEGLISKENIHAEIGEVISGTRPGRTSEGQITFFKSCGIAVQDAAAAQLALIEAERLDLGIQVEL